MAVPSLTDINNVLATRKNQFDEEIYSSFFRTNPFAALFPRKEFNLEGGRIPEVITATFELPQAYPFGLPKLAINGPVADGADSTDVAATIVRSGWKKRAYELEVAAIQTEILNLTDLQVGAYNLTDQIAAKEQGLAEYATVWHGDWFRVHNIGMLNTKLSTTSATKVTQKSDALYDFSTLALPTHALNWVHLNFLYDMLCRKGAGKYAVGQSQGAPIFSLTTGPGLKRSLYQDDTKVRDTVNLSPDVLKNFNARGITTAINGFAPNVDEFPIRYAADGITPIYPTINQNTSEAGRESVPNPQYLTVANDGLAVYEVATILCQGIYEVHPRPVGPLGAGKAKFDPVNYAGEVEWINNKDMANNPQGNKGYYRLDIQQAAKPVRPQLGYSILTLAVD